MIPTAPSNALPDAAIGACVAAGVSRGAAIMVALARVVVSTDSMGRGYWFGYWFITGVPAPLSPFSEPDPQPLN
ncbi:hypothetical protein [Halomonas urumqiensis]|uniref:Uncharacterized protein n=1 Tax=Halomonas urumqiensis TaxID=1684789 RepID=A0A2N7UIR9_9GAMM|nr:hypothetical protein [Halomonas urumqiensis]PMR80309.1 hypothetical protein C1H70_08900 [Halomonas urumqiensis]PTB01587.1 hypothetical protein C6V82_14655 [Halomonas urumqiensis]GHE22323.1 hypothetical protein GCM10017767_28440 [Halomonas urumqiensis]